MVSLAQRSSSGAWIQERGGLKWRTGIFFADTEGKDGTMTSSCLLHLLSSPPLPILILSMLPLQIPKGSQLLGQAGDAAFPGRRIPGSGDGQWVSQSQWIPWLGGLSQGICWGAWGVEEGWGKAFGRREEGSRGRGGLGGSMEGPCPPHSCGSCFETHEQKSGAEPLRASLPGLSQLLPQLRLCPSCWKWDET